MSGEFAFCQPDESSASIVIETSADVCVCQLLNPRELKIPSKPSALENTPAVVRLCPAATPTIFLTPSARSSGVIAAVCGKCREGAAYVARAPAPAMPAASRASGIGRRSGSGCCTLARLSADRTTCRKLSSSNLLVKARAVRRQTRCAPRPHDSLRPHSDEWCYWRSASARTARRRKAPRLHPQSRVS